MACVSSSFFQQVQEQLQNCSNEAFSFVDRDNGIKQELGCEPSQGNLYESYFSKCYVSDQLVKWLEDTDCETVPTGDCASYISEITKIGLDCYNEKVKEYQDMISVSCDAVLDVADCYERVFVAYEQIDTECQNTATLFEPTESMAPTPAPMTIPVPSERTIDLVPGVSRELSPTLSPGSAPPPAPEQGLIPPATREFTIEEPEPEPEPEEENGTTASKMFFASVVLVCVSFFF